MSHFIGEIKIPIKKTEDKPEVLRRVIHDTLKRLAKGFEGATCKVVKKGIQKGKSKRKGTAYEKKIGAILGNWWWSKPFRHQPGSGAWDKQAKDGQVIAPGDLVIPKESEFPFCVECKKRKELPDILNPNSELYQEGDWWDKCLEDAAIAHKIPMLVFGADNKSDYVVLKYNGRLVDILDECGLDVLKSMMYIEHGFISIEVFKLKHLIDTVKPNELKSCLEGFIHED